MEQRYHSNPLFDEWLAMRELEIEAHNERKKYLSGDFVWSTRQEMRLRYSFAVPCDEAIDVMLENCPLIELGAGTGYWANVINANGGNIVAFDKFPPKDGSNFYFRNPDQWFDVQYGDDEKLKEYPDRTLFLCWPDYDTPMAYEAVKKYTGDVLIYEGEDEYGCTGNKAFHQLLERKWKLENKLMMPQWEGIHDYLFVYCRQ